MEYYGACTSIRIWYDNKEVEFGIVESSWMASSIDAGIKQVLLDSYQVSVDKKQYFNE